MARRGRFGRSSWSPVAPTCRRRPRTLVAWPVSIARGGEEQTAGTQQGPGHLGLLGSARRLPAATGVAGRRPVDGRPHAVVVGRAQPCAQPVRALPAALQTQPGMPREMQAWSTPDGTARHVGVARRDPEVGRVCAEGEHRLQFANGRLLSCGPLRPDANFGDAGEGGLHVGDDLGTLFGGGGGPLPGNQLIDMGRRAPRKSYRCCG